MDTTEQTEKQKKIKRRNMIGGVVLFGLIIIGSIWCGVAVSNSGRPEPGALPCKEDWDPVQVDAVIRDDPYEYVGQCFELEGTVEYIIDDAIGVRSDAGHIFPIFTEDRPPCVMGNIAEGSRVSASAYLRFFPSRNADGTFSMTFDCVIPEVNPNL